MWCGSIQSSAQLTVTVRGGPISSALRCNAFPYSLSVSAPWPEHNYLNQRLENAEGLSTDHKSLLGAGLGPLKTLSTEMILVPPLPSPLSPL